jgi:regulatory protein
LPIASPIGSSADYIAEVPMDCYHQVLPKPFIMQKMKRPPRKIPTQQNLANVALHYLGRFAASESSLRRVLDNRLRRAAMDNPDFAADVERQRTLRATIEAIIDGHKKTGALDDAAFAETKINSLRRQGRSCRMIQQKLAAKGIRRDIVGAALVQHADGADPEEVELKAARALARRRKLGPFRKATADEGRQYKDFAVMARAGFSPVIIRAALQSDIEVVEDYD